MVIISVESSRWGEQKLGQEYAIVHYLIYLIV